MLVIHSAVDGAPLASIHRHEDLMSGANGRTDLNPAAEPLQVALICCNKARSFANHKHIPNPRTVEMTQESWYVVGGTVRVSLFDLDGVPVEGKQPLVLNGGDLLIIHRGGHGYYCEAGSVVLEFKSPQFVGVECDKVLL